ncbi:hypothetical protein MPL3365_30288 [Mesorhizobium plurifarium]|uniref:Uncharacterized protein n=1 Tax=Mesorhizobium plurifarium TaxID=69974 RepID=A0A090GE96_MESPL|nr:hypothetical protein MPL3365_30288 [Mesorhizobium plurifarium]
MGVVEAHVAVDITSAYSQCLPGVCASLREVLSKYEFPNVVGLGHQRLPLVWELAMSQVAPEAPVSKAVVIDPPTGIAFQNTKQVNLPI